MPFADVSNAMPKFVASKTLANAAGVAELDALNGNVSDEMQKLKDQPGDTSISGSPMLVRSLLSDGVLDELRLLVHPVVVGSGKRYSTTSPRAYRWRSSTSANSARRAVRHLCTGRLTVPQRDTRWNEAREASSMAGSAADRRWVLVRGASGGGVPTARGR